MSKLKMDVFQITVPFQLNWRYVVPKDYETIEYFLTPNLSLVMSGIVAGRKPFYIGAELPLSKGNKKKFMEEVLPQRSQERINRSFSEEISAFLTLEEAKQFEELFKEQEFICRRIEVHYFGRQLELPELPPEDFHLASDKLIEMKAILPLDFETEGSTVKNIYDHCNDRNAKYWRDRQAKRQNMTKDTAVKKSVIAMGLVMVSAACAGVSRRLFMVGGWWGIAGGLLCAGLSVAAGVLGRGFVEDSMEYLRKGWFAQYV